MRTKLLEGNIEVRGNLEIGNANTLDTDVSNNYSIILQGNLTAFGTGTIDFQENTATFNGSVLQTINFDGKGINFYNMVVNNANGLTIQDDILILDNGNVDLQNGIVTPQAAEVVTFQDAATVTSASNASFIDGLVEKIGNDTDPFVFPIGNNGFYQPLEISAPLNDTDAFQAQYFNADPSSSYNTESKESTIFKVSKLEYWELSNTVGTATVDVTLHWNENSGVQEPSNLVVSHWDGSEWEDFGNDLTTGVVNSGSITVNNVNSFSPFSLGSTDNTNSLPVDLLKFESNESNGIVELTWVTTSEINNDFFEILKSTNGKNWRTLGKVHGHGTTTETNYYSYLDENFQSSVAYYKLKQVDFDGTVDFSRIVNVSRKFANYSELLIYPNPVEDNFIIKSEDEITNFKIINSHGQVLMLGSNKNEPISTKSWVKGIYFLFYQHNGKVKSTKFLVK